MTCLLYWLCHCTLVCKRSTFCNQFKLMNETVKKNIKKSTDRPKISNFPLEGNITFFCWPIMHNAHYILKYTETQALLILVAHSSRFCYFQIIRSIWHGRIPRRANPWDIRLRLDTKSIICSINLLFPICHMLF